MQCSSCIHSFIPSRFPELNITSGILMDKEACRISAYDNVDDKRSPRAPLSEISELTEFSDPWAEVNSEVHFSFYYITLVSIINGFIGWQYF